MKRKKLWAFLAAVAGLGVFYGLVGQGQDKGLSYRFVEVERGTVEQVVASTGALQATETVQVGTQVSGLISDIYVDFNDQVKEGQLLARIDPTILQQEVRSAEATLARSRAELEQANRTLARATELYEAKAATTSDLETAQYQHDVASASFEQAQISLERAGRNLEYTEIRAPIDGVVIQRAVEVGQTVAASMSAPTLFVLAGDLGEMDILAAVDESDIGLITHGQEVRFTVQAYPEESFRGAVSQVRLQSATVENIVTYDVVIDVANVDGKLLPGMTATVDFIVARAEDVLMVSNSALRFSPTEAMVAELAEHRESSGAAETPRPDASAGDASARPMLEAGWSGGRGGQSPNEELSARLYFLSANGELAMAPVTTGLTDGQSTVIEGPGIAEGMTVIAAVTSNTSTATAPNPFQSQGGARPPGGPRV